MFMKNFSLRGIDERTMAQLKTVARRQGLSVNSFILRLIELGLGGKARGARQATYHDLDELAGTWSKEQAKEFSKKIAGFEKLDTELWRDSDSSRH